MVNTILRKWSFSITSYVVISVILIHLIVIPFLYQTVMNGYKENTYEQYIGHVREVSGLLVDVLSLKSMNEDKEDILNILNTTILGGNIQFIEIIDSQGTSLTPLDSAFYYSENFTEDESINQNNDDVYYLSIPVYFKNDIDNISHLRLGFDESAVIKDYNNVKKNIIYIFTAYFIVIIFLITAITRFIHKPLYQLRDRSRDIVKGKLKTPLKISSRLNEIQYLANDLEEMRSSLVNLAESMKHKATHDELTDLPNRYLFNDRLELTIALAARKDNKFAILLLDLDRFKEINDTLGHGIGDEVLIMVSRRMHKGLRESDTIARIGGDEFSFILVGASQIVAERMAKKIIEIIEPCFEINGHSLKVGASVGISVYPDDGVEAYLLMSRADVAMYHAKHNNLHIASYHAEMDSDHYEKLMLVNDLKASIKNGEFEALFQPKINLLTGMPCGCELLLRWKHPNLGLICPDKFIPIAERENLIGELTKWVVTKYLPKFNELIKQDKNFHVAINVSPVDLLDNSLLNFIDDLLVMENFPKNNLYIEVTENAIMKNPIRSAEILEKFRDAGVMISIDDFGTGYSSLSYLQKFPISELKIDKSFISDLSKESTNYPIVNATITMAHDLGISVVAEGVEDEPVLTLLKSMGCDRVQGYLYSRPLHCDAMIDWIKDYTNSTLN